MLPITEVVMDRKDKVFEPALSLSYAKGFDIDHYLRVTESIIAMMSRVSGLSEKRLPVNSFWA